MQSQQKKRVQKLLKRFEYLKSERGYWESLWNDVATYIRPSRLEGKNKKKTSRKRFSTYAIKANETHADGLQGALVSASSKWFRFKFREEKVGEIPYAKDWLEYSESKLLGLFNDSPFYSTIKSFLADGGAFGTACIFSEWNTKRETVSFKVFPIFDIYLTEDQYGEVNGIFHEIEMTVKQIKDKFSPLPEELKISLDNAEPDKKKKILHIVQTREKRDKDKLDNKNMPYSSLYLYKDTEDVLKESGYEEFPFHIWRYRKNSDEIYGRGPGIDSLEDVIILNQSAKCKTRLGQMLSDPPTFWPENMRGRINLTPGAKNYYSQQDKLPQGQPNYSGNYPISIEEERDRKSAINDFFETDYFEMLKRSQRQMTAYEVSERQSEKAVVIGAKIGRLYQEGLNPLITRVFMLMMRHGKILPPPPELLENGTKIDIELIGPLAMAQRGYSMNQGIQKSIQGLMPLAQINPSVLDNFNFDKMGRLLAENSGMPQKVIKEQFQIDQERQQRAAQEAQAQQAQQLQDFAKIAPNLNQKTVPESPLDSITQQLAAGMNGGEGA